MAHADGLERLQRAAAAQGGRLLADSYAGIRHDYLWECVQGHRWRARGYSIIKGGWCVECFARRNGEAQRRPERLLDLQATAKAHGGECLDDIYMGINARYRFRCANGHEWLAWGHFVLKGSWCRPCANQAKALGIERMHEVARERGGRCLSEAYANRKTKLVWECHRGHVWFATAGTIINGGAWCPDCFRLRITKNPGRRTRYDSAL